MIQAVDSTLAQVEAVAGWYKIWTTKQNLEKLLAIMEIDFLEFEGDIERQDDLYSISTASEPLGTVSKAYLHKGQRKKTLTQKNL